MYRKLKNVLAAVLTLAIVLSLAACASSPSAQPASPSPVVAATATETPAQTPAPTKEPVTITLMVNSPGGSTWNDNHDSDVQQEILRVTGIVMEVQEAADDKYNVVIASGDLPDLIRFDASKNADVLINGKHLIPLDDLLTTNGQDILKNVPQAIAIRKKYNSFNQDKLYSIPAQVGWDAMAQEDTIGPTIRWDLYKEIGCPEIKNMDDLLVALQKMVNAHPTTAEGKKVYGVGFWSDWGTWPFTILGQAVIGTYPIGNAMVYNSDSSKIVNGLTDINAPFWDNIHFFYKANQMGIFAKDSFIMKNADFNAMCTSGQMLFSFATWATGDFNKENAKDKKGFMVIPFNWGGQWNGAYWPVGWGGKDYGITTSCKTPDRAMDLLNYFVSFDGCRTLYSGVKGKQWDIVDGVAKLKPETLQLKAAGGDAWTKTGIGVDLNIIGLSSSNINPADNSPVDLFFTQDTFNQGLSPLQQDFAAYYGVTYPGGIFVKLLKEGKNINQSTQDMLAAGIMPATPDDITRIKTSLNDLQIKYAAKCILAASDAEFEALRTEAIAAFVAAGADTEFQWEQKAWADVTAISKSITGK